MKELLRHRWEEQEKVVDVKIGKSRGGGGNVVKAAQILYKDGSRKWEKFHTTTMSAEMSERLSLFKCITFHPFFKCLI